MITDIECINEKELLNGAWIRDPKEEFELMNILYTKPPVGGGKVIHVLTPSSAGYTADMIREDMKAGKHELRPIRYVVLPHGVVDAEFYRALSCFAKSRNATLFLDLATATSEFRAAMVTSTVASGRYQWLDERQQHGTIN